MDGDTLLRAMAALMITLGAIGALAWGLKRFGALSAPRTARQGDLKIVEWRPVDARRKLAVVHWDGREHLMLLGPFGDVLLADRKVDPSLHPETQTR